MLRAVPSNPTPCRPSRGLRKIQEALALLCCQETAGEVFWEQHVQGPGGEGLGPEKSHGWWRRDERAWQPWAWAPGGSCRAAQLTENQAHGGQSGWVRFYMWGWGWGCTPHWGTEWG